MIMFITGQYLFGELASKESRLLSYIQRDSSRFLRAVQFGVSIRDISNRDVVAEAKSSIRLNKVAAVDQIEKISNENLEDFLGSMRLFSFSSSSPRGICKFLLGLSSFDGTRAYVSGVVADKNFKEKTRRLLEHEMMNNLPRWRSKDYRLISPLHNENLRVDGQMVEAGDYYTDRVYGEGTSDPSPFTPTELWR